MSAGNLVRVVAVLAACVAAVGSATSNNASQNPSMMPQYGQQQPGPPPPQQMEPGRALGLWRSTFGAVKIEADNSKGGLQTGAVQGVWVYQREGQEVVGYFSGNLRGNVLQFRWQEPNNPPLTGEGYLVFDVGGRQYAGRWWSDKRDRVGDWNGWRQGASQGGQPDPNQGYGGQPYGGGAPYGGQPYGNPQPYNGGPYGGQGYQQPYQPYSQPPQPGPQPGPQPPPGRRYY